MKKLAIIISLILSPTLVFAKGDAKAGKAKAAACVACHGAKGISPNPLWPNLAGQQAGYLAKQMKDFKSGKRKDPVMTGMAAAINPADIANIAAYYASLK